MSVSFYSSLVEQDKLIVRHRDQTRLCFYLFTCKVCSITRSILIKLSNTPPGQKCFIRLVLNVFCGIMDKFLMSQQLIVSRGVS